MALKMKKYKVHYRAGSNVAFIIYRHKPDGMLEAGQKLCCLWALKSSVLKKFNRRKKWIRKEQVNTIIKCNYSVAIKKWKSTQKEEKYR
jgi:hypothetical protein